MVKVQIEADGGIHEYYMDGGKKANFDSIKKFVYKDWDMCFIYSGPEGAGKSTMCFQDAKYLDPTFNIDRICFKPQDFEDKIKKENFLKKGNALVLDEGFVLNARASMTEINRKFLSVLAECRQKNLFLFIVLPNFFDLDRNLALWRSRGLFYVYHDRMERGYFKYFSYEKKKKLYIAGKKFFNYSAVRHDFIGRFPKYMVVDATDYKGRKLQAFHEKQQEKEIMNKWMVVSALLVKLLIQEGRTQQQIVEYLQGNNINLTRQAISYHMCKMQEAKLLI